MTGNTGKISARAAVALVFAVCAAGFALAQDVSYNAMPGTDFSKFKTYKWIEIPGAQHPDQIVDAQIKQAFDTQLAAKKLTKITADNADLYVGYYPFSFVEMRMQPNDKGGGRLLVSSAITEKSGQLQLDHRTCHLSHPAEPEAAAERVPLALRGDGHLMTRGAQRANAYNGGEWDRSGSRSYGDDAGGFSGRR